MKLATLRRLLIGSFIGVLLFSVAPGATAGELAQGCISTSDWLRSETPGGIIALAFPSSESSLANHILTQYGSELESIFYRYSAVFGNTLTLPITIRIYPNVADYECLNVLPPPISFEQTHSHLGSQEIVLIGENIETELAKWDSEALNDFRYEIVALFAEQLSGKVAPPGLIAGIGGYGQDPSETFEARFSASGLGFQPSDSWSSIWENQFVLASPEKLVQATSVVAYLIDVYGWETFTDFLTEISKGRSYRDAIQEVYGFRLQDLQEHWRTQYFPVYIAGRWRVNIFYKIDLEPIETLIEEGAYSDALKTLLSLMPVIEGFGDEAQLAAANNLIQQAQAGQSAAALMQQARDALLNEDYEASFNFAQQADALYSELGNSTRQEELDSYISWSEEVLSLRSELSSLNISTNPFATPRIQAIGIRLAEMGDEAGLNAAREAMNASTSTQRLMATAIVSLCLLMAVIFAVRRLLSIRHQPPREAELL